ncbi:hypothetical protein [Bradyrhizobium sp. CCBAU 11434]|uniref:hypothetical protein n=1 Tax=Bradyrhizobium sp. CCBAU 11434 TaxID=1630885 RepID=UPI0023067F9E|nr:hypothetical protein [Bradyrhizobium sp. CCBAU 11434]
MTFLPEWLRFLGSAFLAFFGLLVLAILIFPPSGLAGIRWPGKFRCDEYVKTLALVAASKRGAPMSLPQAQKSPNATAGPRALWRRRVSR